MAIYILRELWDRQSIVCLCVEICPVHMSHRPVKQIPACGSVTGIHLIKQKHGRRYNLHFVWEFWSSVLFIDWSRCVVVTWRTRMNERSQEKAPHSRGKVTAGVEDRETPAVYVSVPFVFLQMHSSPHSAFSLCSLCFCSINKLHTLFLVAAQAVCSACLLRPVVWALSVSSAQVAKGTKSDPMIWAECKQDSSPPHRRNIYCPKTGALWLGPGYRNIKQTVTSSLVTQGFIPCSIVSTYRFLSSTAWETF